MRWVPDSEIVIFLLVVIAIFLSYNLSSSRCPAFLTPLVCVSAPEMMLFRIDLQKFALPDLFQ